MSSSFLVFSQSHYLIQIVDINSHTANSADPDQLASDLHCLQSRIYGFSRTRVNVYLLVIRTWRALSRLRAHRLSRLVLPCSVNLQYLLQTTAMIASLTLRQELKQMLLSPQAVELMKPQIYSSAFLNTTVNVTTPYVCIFCSLLNVMYT